MNLKKHSQWSQAADLALGATLGNDRESIIRDVNAGRCELWDVNEGAAWVVTCASLDDQELAVCCVAGRGLVDLSTVLVDIAAATGLTRVRFFTKRPALKRLLRHLPIALDGYVFTCEVPHAQRKQITPDSDISQRRH